MAETATGPPARKIYKKGKPPIAVLILLFLLNTGTPHMKICEKLAAHLATQEAGKALFFRGC
jgi:hypothetical protein